MDALPVFPPRPEPAEAWQLHLADKWARATARAESACAMATFNRRQGFDSVQSRPR